MKNNWKRYYLHKKLKKYGASIDSRRRTVEIDDQLFRYPTALLKTYLHKLKKFNYSIQSVIMIKDEETKQNGLAKTTKPVSLVKSDVLTEKFKYVNSRVPILEKSSLELKVTSKEQLVIAENNALEAANLWKEVDNVRKILKAPYAETVKAIDGYCKIITENLDRIKTRFTSEITNFKVLQEAAAKIEREKKLEEVEITLAEKKQEAERLARIETQIVVRIFGGTYITRSGVSQTSPGCVKSADCDFLLNWINDNVPAISTFKHFPNQYEDMLKSVKKRLALHKLNLIDIETKDYPTAREGAIKRINEARTEAQVKVEESKTVMTKVIERSVNKEIKTANKEVDEAGKGVRDSLKYVVTDELLVPRDLLSVDDSKILKYINENRDKLKEKIAANEEILPGIKFFVESNFIAR